jgi:hypothetical protein
MPPPSPLHPPPTTDSLADKRRRPRKVISKKLGAGVGQSVGGGAGGVAGRRGTNMSMAQGSEVQQRLHGYGSGHVPRESQMSLATDASTASSWNPFKYVV